MRALEYVAKFIELAHLWDDYVVTDMAKVRKFEDGLKLSIRGKIMGFLLQHMDSMIRKIMAIDRERLMTQRASEMRVLVGRGRRAYESQGQVRATSQTKLMTCYYCHQPRNMKRDFLQRQGS